MNRLKSVMEKHPLVKGMVAYSIIWPTGCTIQQYIMNEPTDWKKKLRYGIYGGFVVAPMLYGWIKLSSAMHPHTNLLSALKKTAWEQVSYAPVACASFFFGMSLLEHKTIAEGFEEVKMKFVPTFTTGLCVWPIIQTINFSVIAEKNRVPFTSVCSMLWTIYLAYMKQRTVSEESEHHSNINNISPVKMNLD